MVRIVIAKTPPAIIMAPKKYAGLTHWQWQQWQYDRRMAYQKAFPPKWRLENDPYFQKHTSETTKEWLRGKE
jgi:hypothetical protein